MIAQEQHGRFGKSPLEVRIAHCFAGSSPAFARRFLAAFDQATIRGEILPAGKAADVMDVVEQHEAEDFSNTRYRL